MKTHWRRVLGTRMSAYFMVPGLDLIFVFIRIAQLYYGNALIMVTNYPYCSRKLSTTIIKPMLMFKSKLYRCLTIFFKRGNFVTFNVRIHLIYLRKFSETNSLELYSLPATFTTLCSLFLWINYLFYVDRY